MPVKSQKSKMLFEGPARRIIRSNDLVKLFFWTPKLMCGLIFLWPETQKDRFKATLSYIVNMGASIFLCSGLFLYIRDHWDNFNESAYATCLAMMPLLGITKITFLWYNFEEIKLLFIFAKTHFWPYDLLKGTSKSSIINYYRYSNLFALTVYLIGIAYSLMTLFAPLFRSTRSLPFDVVYLFDWTVSPFYELVYFGQVFAFVGGVYICVAGTDYLFLAFVITLMSQYRILQECFSKFNTKNMADINKKMRKICCDGLEEKYDEKKEYFVRCVIHHQRLLSYMDRLNRVLNPLELSQLAFGISGICLGALRLTNLENATTIEIAVSFLYVFGYLMQLSVDCFLGSQLYHQASLLPEAIFHSNWIELEDDKFKNDIKFALLHSQRIPQLTAYNVYDMNMISFLKVLKLAFSFYTLLSSLSKK